MPRQKTVLLGPMSRNSATVAHYVPPPQSFPTPDKVCNAASQGRYTGPTWNLRPGAEDHLRHKSFGVGC